MNQILLDDILNLSKFESTKIRFQGYNSIANIESMDLYLSNRDNIDRYWLLWTSNRSLFKVGDIAVSLVKEKNKTDIWLLTNIVHIDKVLDISNGIGYEATPIEEYTKYFGRLEISYHKRTQTSVRKFKSISNDLIVHSILSQGYYDQIIPFPGYYDVDISFSELRQIIRLQPLDWITALSNKKAIYEIFDTSNGKMYIGSASSDNGMLLSRWKDYSETGHGGDKSLRELGIKHIEKYFRYRILELFDKTTSDDIILRSEDKWKCRKYTREFGYNRN